jgi:hypothetical protein
MRRNAGDAESQRVAWIFFADKPTGLDCIHIAASVSVKLVDLSTRETWPLYGDGARRKLLLILNNVSSASKLS